MLAMFGGARMPVREQRRAHDGSLVWMTRWEMPRLGDSILQSAIYLYGDEKQALDGTGPGASGCLIGIESTNWPDTHSHVYAVTAKHVINAGLIYVRMQNAAEKIDVPPIEAGDWLSHDKSDLSVAWLGLHARDSYRFTVLTADMFITPEIIRDRGIGPGDEVFMVGRYIDAERRQHTAPSVRFGNISMMPTVPIRHPSEKRPEISFVVEMRSVGGYSGAPTYVHLPLMSIGNYTVAHIEAAQPIFNPSAGTRLLGIDWSHHREWSPFQKRYEEPDPDAEYGVYTDTAIAYVVPAWRVLALLQETDFVKQRKDEEDRNKPSQATALDAPNDALTKEKFEDVLKRASRPVDPKRKGK